MSFPIPSDIGAIIQTFTTMNLRLCHSWRDAIDANMKLITDELKRRYPGIRRTIDGSTYSTLFTSMQDAIASGETILTRRIVAYTGYLPINWDLLIFSFDPIIGIIPGQKIVVEMLMNHMIDRGKVYLSFLLGERKIFNKYTKDLPSQVVDDIVKLRDDDPSLIWMYQQPSFFCITDKNYNAALPNIIDHYRLSRSPDCIRTFYNLKYPNNDKPEVLTFSNSVMDCTVKSNPASSTIAYLAGKNIEIGDMNSNIIPTETAFAVKPYLCKSIDLESIFFMNRPDLFELLDYHIADILRLIPTKQMGKRTSDYFYHRNINWVETVILMRDELKGKLSAQKIPANWRRQLACAIVLEDTNSIHHIQKTYQTKYRDVISQLNNLIQQFPNTSRLIQLI